MRETLQIILALFVLLGLGGLVYVAVFGSGRAPTLEVVDIEGPVQSQGASGERVDLTMGSALGARDQIVVAAGGRAVLAMGEGTELTLGPNTRLRVLGVEREGIRVELGEGRIQARVRSGSPLLSITSKGRSIRATEAEFSVAVDADGAMVARAEAGSLELEGFGDVQSLGPGAELSAFPGQPTVLGSISQALLLEVAWPEGRIGAQVPLEGQTAPYAQVTVRVGEAEETIRADGDGHFASAIELPVGETRIAVEASDATGEASADTRLLEREAAGPRTQTEVLWGP
jgi:hypothetical protein